jgi:O-antigen ligase
VILAVALSWIVTSKRASISHRLLIALATVAVGFVVVLVLLDTPAVSRFASLLNFESDVTASYRLQSMADGLRRFWESPLIGAGLGVMPTDVVFDGAGQTVVYPHNMIVELLAATGIVGLTVALAPILVALRLLVTRCRSPHASPWAVAVLGCLLFFLISAQFSGSLEVNRHIWTFAVLGGAPALAGSLS